MRLTLRAPIVLSFKSTWARATVFLLLGIIRAALVSYFVFAAFVYPLYNLRWFGKVLVGIAQILYLPIDWFSRLVPPLESPFAGHPEWALPAQIFWRHMVAGTLTYFAIFYIPSIIRLMRSRFRGQVAGRA